MSLKNDTLPNEFWKHLGIFDLSDYSQPRWSILCNDNGLQVITTVIIGIRGVIVPVTIPLVLLVDELSRMILILTELA